MTVQNCYIGTNFGTRNFAVGQSIFSKVDPVNYLVKPNSVIPNISQILNRE
jgi:hypothetical protein